MKFIVKKHNRGVILPGYIYTKRGCTWLYFISTNLWMLTCLGRHNLPVLCTISCVCPIITTAQARCLPKQCRTKRHQQYTVVACSCQSGKCCLDVYCTRLCGTSLYEPRCSLQLYIRHVYCTRERPSPYQRNNKVKV